MQIDLTKKQYRRLLDLVYIGNWVLNSRRDDSDRIAEFDEVESVIFSHCHDVGMESLVMKPPYSYDIPSQEYVDGGIHEAIAVYEDDVFFEILAQELAMRDMDVERLTEENLPEAEEKMEKYLAEFVGNGCDNVYVSGIDEED